MTSLQTKNTRMMINFFLILPFHQKVDIVDNLFVSIFRYYIGFSLVSIGLSDKYTCQVMPHKLCLPFSKGGEVGLDFQTVVTQHFISVALSCF